MHEQLKTHCNITHRLVNRGSDHGIRCVRERVNVLCISSRLRWVRPLEVLLKYTGSIPRMCVSEYWQCSDSERQSELTEWPLILFICDLDQNPTSTANDSTNGRSRMVIYGQGKPANLQTLTRHQVLWNSEFKEVLSAVDMARVHNSQIGE